MFGVSVSKLINTAIIFSEAAVKKAQSRKKEAHDRITSLEGRIRVQQRVAKDAEAEAKLASGIAEKLTEVREQVSGGE